MMAGPGPEEALSTTAGAAEATAITPERMEAVLMMEALVESWCPLDGFVDENGWSGYGYLVDNAQVDGWMMIMEKKKWRKASQKLLKYALVER
jgi:hypothetical protein